MRVSRKSCRAKSTSPTFPYSSLLFRVSPPPFSSFSSFPLHLGKAGEKSGSGRGGGREGGFPIPVKESSFSALPFCGVIWSGQRMEFFPLSLVMILTSALAFLPNWQCAMKMMLYYFYISFKSETKVVIKKVQKTFIGNKKVRKKLYPYFLMCVLILFNLFFFFLSSLPSCNSARNPLLPPPPPLFPRIRRKKKAKRRRRKGRFFPAFEFEGGGEKKRGAAGGHFRDIFFSFLEMREN